MVWIRGPVVVLYVAAITVSRSAGELAVDMALIAGDIHVRARQWEFRKGIVIEICAVPGCGGMAE